MNVTTSVLVVYLLVLMGLAVWSRGESNTVAGYFIGNKRLPPWVVAFSTNATGESGWLLLGLGMPNGKPAGVRCAQLTADNHCQIFGQPDRPVLCANLHPSLEICGTSDENALAYLAWLERITRPCS